MQALKLLQKNKAAFWHNVPLSYDKIPQVEIASTALNHPKYFPKLI